MKIFENIEDLQFYIDQVQNDEMLPIIGYESALKFSIAKWHPWNPNRGWSRKAAANSCGLCVFHKSGGCFDCILRGNNWDLVSVACDHEDHIYHRFAQNNEISRYLKGGFDLRAEKYADMIYETLVHEYCEFAPIFNREND